MRALAKLAAVALLALSLEGCASDVMDYDPPPMAMPRAQTTVENNSHKPLQCVPYARAHSGIKIYGDAYTWWDQAAGKYPRGALPEPGAVMVLHDYAGPNHGHVAVVRGVVDAREIRVDHANWLNDGSIYVNDPVQDVSRDNDWSVVRVFNLKTGGWGGRLYPVQGFIGSTGDRAPESDRDLVAGIGGANRGATTLIAEIN
ncbi:MAG TPA: CHAP domain-containing protein [Rhizomicrobium sp.]|nr:CHAP domain-containing protein [Rhizomicrobium sp.]